MRLKTRLVVFAYGRDDLMGYPAFESFGLRFARAEDEGVEAGFVDDGHVWVSTITVQNLDGILFVFI